MREQNHVTYARAVSEQHDQAIDSDATASGWRHAIFERTYIVRIEIHRFLVTRILGLHLRMESSGLIFRVVEFGEAIGDFATGNEQLVALGNARTRINAKRL